MCVTGKVENSGDMKKMYFKTTTVLLPLPVCVVPGNVVHRVRTLADNAYTILYVGTNFKFPVNSILVNALVSKRRVRTDYFYA